ncbi:MAG TPA: hypothetical protein VI456_15340, partial [Polyangia bacterium]
MTARHATVLLLCAGLAGCATVPRRKAPAADGPALAGWEALADGRRADAARLFAARLAAAPADPVALLGRAAIADARGEAIAAAA